MQMHLFDGDRDASPVRPVEDPWKLTYRAFTDEAFRGLPASHWSAMPSTRRSQIVMFEARARVAHEAHVQAALEAGLPVPRRVLAEYPTLRPASSSACSARSRRRGPATADGRGGPGSTPSTRTANS